MKKPTVFVVDDEPQICALLTRILQREGYAVHAFTAGQQAVDALAAERPDVLVTDLMMPGLNGIDVVRRAKEMLPSMGAVLTSGFASIDSVVDALRSGVDDFVTKPFSVAEIRSVVTRVLQKPRSEAAAAAPVPARGPAAADAPTNVFARRLREMSVVENLHGLLCEDVATLEILPRCSSTLLPSLGAGRAVLMLPAGRDAVFRARSATLADGPWTARAEVESGALALLAASGAPAALDREALGAAAPLLEDGPLAAAPISPRDPAAPDAGVLVVSRPAGGNPFEAEDLRLLGVAAAALGDVVRAVRSAERAEDAYAASLCDVVEATESRSRWFVHHSERVRDLSLGLGRRLGLPATELEVLETASRLLDLGRVGTPDDLLRKPGSPSPEEWRTLQHHSVAAERLVRPLGRLRHVKPVIRHHHENWDGTGYPDGLRGHDIPYLAALVRITDAYAALTSSRAWRDAVEPADAVRQIVALSGRHFHPQLAAAFAEMQLEPPAQEERP